MDNTNYIGEKLNIKINEKYIAEGKVKTNEIKF